MKNLVVLYGESSSGKSAIKREILKIRTDYNDVITSTTRPPREGEQNKVDYNFRGDMEIAAMIMEDKMVECVVFRDWVYGTERAALLDNEINIGVWNPEGVETLNNDGEMNCLNVYIHSTDKQRLLRSLNREENPDVDEIIRRFKTDKTDFDVIDVDFFSTIENDGTKTLEQLAIEVIAKIDRHLGRFV